MKTFILGFCFGVIALGFWNVHEKHEASTLLAQGLKNVQNERFFQNDFFEVKP